MRVAKTSANRSALLAAMAKLLLAAPAWASQPKKSPVKVFILAGQSNMDGQGVISGPQKGTLETLVKDPVSRAAVYKHLVDKDGKWVVRDDVWCVFGDNKGKLTVGGFVRREASAPNWGSAGWSATISTTRCS